MTSEAVSPNVEVPRSSSYSQILKASGMMGGSSACALLVTLVRTKAMAVMLGPAGFGLIGALSSVTDVARTIAGVGIGSSGARQVAHASRDSTMRVARTARVLMILAVLLGVAGASVVAFGSTSLSLVTFGTTQHAHAVALVAVVVLLSVIADARVALLQGLRRIGDVAKIGILGPLLGTAAALPLVYWFGKDGIAPALVALAAAMLAASLWYSRRLDLAQARLDATNVREEVVALLRLGATFMLSAVIAVGALYLVRVIVLHRLGLEAAGVYHAAWALGGLYVGFILQAMSADFLPRLTMAGRNNAECNRLVNEQALVGLLLSAPGVLGTIALAGWAIPVLYSAQFGEAAGLVRWFCVGMALRVVAWPMSFMLVARSEAAWAVAVDVIWGVTFVALSWVLVPRFGIDGAGMAFVAAYVLNIFVVYPVVRHMTGFRWSTTNLTTMLALFATVAMVLTAFHAVPASAALAFGCVASAGWAWRAASALAQLVPNDRLPQWFHRALAWRSSLSDRHEQRPY